MSVSIVVRKGAARDIKQAHDWYESEQAGLGKEFLDEVDACFMRIKTHAHGYAFAYRDAKRATIRRFPYNIYFRIRENEARIIVVVHQRRHAKVWQDRVK